MGILYVYSQKYLLNWLSWHIFNVTHFVICKVHIMNQKWEYYHRYYDLHLFPLIWVQHSLMWTSSFRGLLKQHGLLSLGIEALFQFVPFVFMAKHVKQSLRCCLTFFPHSLLILPSGLCTSTSKTFMCKLNEIKSMLRTRIPCYFLLFPYFLFLCKGQECLFRVQCNLWDFDLTEGVCTQWGYIWKGQECLSRVLCKLQDFDLTEGVP